MLTVANVRNILKAKWLENEKMINLKYFSKIYRLIQLIIK